MSEDTKLGRFLRAPIGLAKRFCKRKISNWLRLDFAELS
jgi:hypothetical protein